MVVRTIALLLLVQAGTVSAQDRSEPDIWEPFRYFLGAWDGQETGKAGIGKGQRRYEFILDGRYLHFKNESVFEAQEKNPEGEVHGDWTFFSYDMRRQKFVLREFHSEGFVNQYVLDTISTDGKWIVFVTEAIENIPSGFRARVTYAIDDEKRFVETFQLASPGKDYSPILKNTWTRREE